MQNTEIKVGTLIKAIWDGTFSEVVKIEGNLVYYKNQSYSNKDRENGLFIDSIKAISEHFQIVDCFELPTFPKEFSI